MDDIAIRVENLSKRYRIGGKQARYKTLRDTLSGALTTPFRRLSSALRGDGAQAANDETIWALKDVSFEVKRGEVVGIIGRNGAGKTTLLKILSRITEPTAGEAEIHGRVGSLLEVGTGFHPELTGRENVYLNGAILGMKRAEINRKFNEIVAFAEVERFIDTPIKHYSSGMQVRLAFSVAAHLEPDILAIDEVLAVGDAEFQRRCFNRIKDLYNSGIAALIVSHHLIPIRQLSHKVIWMESGRIQQFGDPEQVCTQYTNELHSTSDAYIGNRDGDGQITVDHIEITDDHGESVPIIESGQNIVFSISCTAHRPTSSFTVGIRIVAFEGTVITGFLTDSESLDVCGFSGTIQIKCQVQQLRLRRGEYSITVFIADKELVVAHDILNSALEFRVNKSSNRQVFDVLEPDTRLTYWGAVTTPHKWFVVS